jgi:endonuclease/exonuclease/phosphatase family metal-dependent hydrolase
MFDARRYAGDYRAEIREDASGLRTLDIVTLKTQFARHIGRAKLLFANAHALASATIVLLQEMDAKGTDALAANLQMSYVYDPATVHRKTGRDFGNAVLSRWPIIRDEKVVLPHLSMRDGSSRTGTAATVSTSLGGDFNGYRICKLAQTHAFEWTTRTIGRTCSVLSLDHIFVQGLRAIEVGKVTDMLGASDHAAVWARLVSLCHTMPRSPPFHPCSVTCRRAERLHVRRRSSEVRIGEPETMSR